MEKTTEVPLIRCEKCESVYNLTVITSGIKIKSLFLDCKNCDQQINIIDKTADAYIEFDADATPNSMLIPANEGYFDDSVWIGTKISILRSAGTNVRIRGIIWGR